MAKQQPYSLVYDPRLFDHLRKVEPKYQALIEKTMTEQLTFEPNRETRNRKPVAMLVAVTAESDADDIVWTPRLQQILDDARQRIAAGEGIPHDQFWKQMVKQSAATEPVSRNPKAAMKPKR